MKNSIITYLKKASVDAIMNEDVDSAEKFMKYAELIKKHELNIWYSEKERRFKTHVNTPKGRILVTGSTEEKLAKKLSEYIDFIVPKKLEELFVDFCEYKQNVRQKSGSTIYKYETLYNCYIKGFSIEKMKIKDIDEDVLAKHFKRVLTNSKKKDGSKREFQYNHFKQFYQMLNEAFNLALRKRLITENPLFFLKVEDFQQYCALPKVKKSKDKIISSSDTDELIQRLYNPIIHNANMITHYAAILNIYTGARPSEIAVLKKTDIDWDDETIYFTHAQKFDRKTKIFSDEMIKTRKTRDFPVTQEIIELLDIIEKYKEENNIDSDYYFFDPKLGEPIHARMISSTIRNHNKKACAYTFRRTLNSQLDSIGVNETVRGALIGNSERVNKEHYTCDIMDINTKRKMIEEARKKNVL